MRPRRRAPRVLLAVGERGAERRVAFSTLGDGPAGVVTRAVHGMRCTAFDLVVVGHLFDGSRAIEAAKRALLHAPDVPLICVRAAPLQTSLSEAAICAFQSAAEESARNASSMCFSFPTTAKATHGVRTLIERLAYVA